MDFTPLALITAQSKNVRIRVRVARCWDFINPRNSSQIYSYELLLIDDQGKTIQASVPDDIADKFRITLLEGNVYHISGFNVGSTPTTYRVSTHPCRFRLPNNTFVKEIKEGTTDIPYDTFNFLTFEDVKERVGMLDYVIDVYGLIIRLGNLERMRSLDQIKHKRSIFIEDASGVEIEVTLWDNIALAFPEDHVVMCGEKKPVCVAIVALVTKAYNVTVTTFPLSKGFTLNITSGTKFFVNPEIPEIVAFAEQVIEPYPYLYKTAPLLDEETDIEDEKEANRKTVAELLQIDIHTDKEIKFACTATIKQINPEEGWWYRACPRCKSSVQNLDDKLWCKNCRFIDALPIAWYRISLIVEDTTGSAPFVLFGRLASDLIGVPAHTLASSFKDRHDVPPMLTKLYGQKRTFQVKLGNLVEDPSKISFKVLYIFKDTLVTPKKEIPSPISARSTHLTIPLAKRSSPPAAQKALQFEGSEPTPQTPNMLPTPTKRRRKDHAGTSGEK